jgi:hypothetical protein
VLSNSNAIWIGSIWGLLFTLGRAGAADEPDRMDNHGHWRTAKPEVGRAARRELDPSKLADNDEVSPELPRRLRRLAHEAVVAEDRPHPTVTVNRRRQGVPGCQVILASRAASVPFTAVTTGPERTATDNTKAASTYAVDDYGR